MLIDRIKPLCPIFGDCGGCFYQDKVYEKELQIKEEAFRTLLKEKLFLSEDPCQPIVASPKEYYYRNSLDLRLIRNKNKEILIGFSPQGKRTKLIPIETCFIADSNICAFIPSLKEKVVPYLLPKHKQANIVVRTCDDGKTRWGGLGKGSLQLKEEEYLWTQIEGKKIFYSLDTFFQANLSILPYFFRSLYSLNIFNKETVLFDLYGGVGLLGIILSVLVKKVILIEECIASIKLARYNILINNLENVEIINGRVEDKLTAVLNEAENSPSKIIFIDPPRAGLSKSALDILKESKTSDYIVYLSCAPESLIRDLIDFSTSGWEIKKIIPFDFFPKTKRLEVLTVLKKALKKEF